VVFLDVQMPGVDGFEVIRRRAPERMPAVVFLTAYDQFAIRAFEAQALDYLLKPASAERFAATLARLKRRLQSEAAASPARDRAIVVTTPRGAAVVPVGEIDWIQAESNYARIWTGGRSYLLREPLRLLEQRIGSHGFARAHRRALVRLAAVRELTSAADGELAARLASGARVPISRRRRAAFTAAVRAQGQLGPSRPARIPGVSARRACATGSSARTTARASSTIRTTSDRGCRSRRPKRPARPRRRRASRCSAASAARISASISAGSGRTGSRSPASSPLPFSPPASR
jgi:two-component system LytT family response regulator